MLKPPALIGADGPAVKKDFRHIVNPDITAGLNNCRVISSDPLNHVEILERENWHDILQIAPLLDFRLDQVDGHFGNLLVVPGNDNSQRSPDRALATFIPESLVFGFGWLEQSDAVEFDDAGWSHRPHEGGSRSYLLWR